MKTRLIFCSEYLIQPERFTKLVTQLKWRLLEGGGQALYEIGVSDSGQLVGLSRQDLEESLDTLERMAGELGATVIISKEVSIPTLLVDRAGLRIDGAPRFPKRRDVDIYLGGDGGDTTSTDDDVETPVDSNADFSLAISPSLVSPIPMPVIKSFPYGRSPRVRSRNVTPPPSRPAIKVLDPNDDDGFAFDIDISTAFDSLSFESSPKLPPAPLLPYKVKKKNKVKKDAPPVVVDHVARAADRRIKRDQRRAEKRRTLITSPPDLAPISLPNITSIHPSPLDILSTTPQIILPELAVDPPASQVDTSESSDAEPKLIVEALVVRKLALEEAFLDFANFSTDG